MINKQKLEELNYLELLTLKQQIERQKILKNPFYLCYEYLGYKDMNSNLHNDIFQRLINFGFDRLLFLIPRGHLKSSTITIGFTIWQILNNQNIRIGIGNAVLDKATEFLDEIKEHLKNPRLIELFPDILWENPEKEAPVWRTDAIVVKRTKIVSGKTIQVFGIDKGITGKHYELVILDDIQDDKNSETSEQIQKVIKRYKNIVSVLEPTGRIIVVGTRWRQDDIYRYLMRDAGYTAYVRRAIENNEPIFPEKFTVKKLQRIRREIGNYHYSCQYENNPIPDELKTFTNIQTKPPEFFSYLIKNFYDKIEDVYILIDPALGKKGKDRYGNIKKPDEAVRNIIFRIGEKYYVYKSDDLHKWAKGKIIKLIRKIIADFVEYDKKFRNVMIGIETVAFQVVLKEWIEREQTKYGVYFNVVELNPHGRSKQSRIERLQPMFDRGDIIINQECSTLIQQLSDYPSITKDDHIDALAYLPDVLEQNANIGVIIPDFASSFEPDFAHNIKNIDYRSL